MKHLKRLAAALLVGVLALTLLAGCGGSKTTAKDYTALTKAVNTKLAAKGHAAITENAEISKKVQELADLRQQVSFVYNVTDEAKLEQLTAANNSISEKIQSILLNLHKTYNGLGEDSDYLYFYICYDKSQDAVAEEIANDLLDWEEETGLTVKSIGFGYEEKAALNIYQSDMTYPEYLYFFSAK